MYPKQTNAMQEPWPNALGVPQSSKWRGMLSKVRALTGLGTGSTGVVLIALLLALVCIPVPYVPERANGCDASWSAVLVHAHNSGWQFGKQIVFTYGPLGYLTTPFFSRSLLHARLLADIALALTVSLGVSLLAARAGMIARGLLILGFVFVSGNIISGSDLLIDIGILCFGLLGWVESGRRLCFLISLLVVLLVFAALEKVSFLFTAWFSITALTVDLLLRRTPGLALALCVGFGGVFVAGWIALGQNLDSFPAFLVNSFGMAAAYDKVMGIQAASQVLAAAAITGCLTVLLLIVRAFGAFANEENGRARRLVLCAWLCGLLFITWKHGFVRADRLHVEFFLGFVAVLALALNVLPNHQPRTEAKLFGLSVICWLLTLVTLQSAMFTGYLRNYVHRPWRCLVRNFQTLSQPAAYWQQRTEESDRECRRAHLPKLNSIVGNSSIDVFGVDQAHVLFNRWRYRPRPVFQSYAACSAPLMKLNEQFYENSSPEYVLFRLDPDFSSGHLRKFPPLEDALVFRHLLINYEPVGAEGGFILLKSNSTERPHLRLLRAGSIRAGERLDLSEYGDVNLWIEVQVAPTPAGRLKHFLYQPGEIRLTIWGRDSRGPAAEFGAPAPMIAAGFLASPLVTDSFDMLDLYTGNAIHRPTAYSFETGSAGPTDWDRTLAYRIYVLDNPIRTCAGHDKFWLKSTELLPVPWKRVQL